MSDLEPTVRVGYMRMMIQQVAHLPASQRARVRPGLQTIEDAVQAAPTLGWMPGAVNFDTCELLTRELGRDGASAFFEGLWPRVWRDAPFFASFVQAMLRLHREPGAYVKYLARGFPHIFRGYGEWTVPEYRAGWARAQLDRAPSRCFADDGAWMHYVAVSLGTLYALRGHEGHARVAELMPAQGRAVLEFEW